MNKLNTVVFILIVCVAGLFAVELAQANSHMAGCACCNSACGGAPKACACSATSPVKMLLLASAAPMGLLVSGTVCPGTSIDTSSSIDRDIFHPPTVEA